ncbi:hypothetical protein TRFO_07048 [Tritrichomonas foetus]|uniref:EF-hand domain-containing protein n=1 Tax=Tritrichomonas foetus TaxID=1144522 RepID=A0A1J4JV79_9EUKA|nr:hypothetical protein TRFO_07048 [Tritrichomonas foetus]|eukprot:OHT02626.1 hypothetical protein TRFO_07048 [Tritrichomonas foetus]
MSIGDFDYKKFIESLGDATWKVEVTNVFRMFDKECEGVLPREIACHAIKLFGINGEDHFHFAKKVISAQTFIDAVQKERDNNIRDSMKRWKYIFSLIAGPGNDTITVDKIQDFFTMFGHTPELKFCEDFIDEFDRVNISKTCISMDDWLMFCRTHRVNF